jgi:hypothetical protein
VTPLPVDGRPECQNLRLGIGGSAASWLLGSRRQALALMAYCTACFALPNVRAKRATTAGRQAQGCDDAPCAAGLGLVACRWRSA